MLRAALVRAAFAACVLLSVQRASADDLADEAELNFTLGAERYQRGDYRGALAHFLASNRLVPNRNVLFNIARCYEELKEFPEAYRYYSLAVEAETDEKARARIEKALASIAKNITVLEITSDPPGATIYLQRRDLGPRGATPRALGLSPGAYTVIAELEGYYPAEVKIAETAPGKTAKVNLKLEPVLGQVSIGPSARGASVRVDASDAPVSCQVPCTLELRPGQHVLYLARQGHHDVQAAVEVVARSKVTVDPRLERLTGNLVVGTDEPGALVQANGRSLGFTPGLFKLPVGPHRVRIEAPGFHPVEREVFVRETGETRLEVTLTQSSEVTAASRSLELVEDAPSSVTIIPRQELRVMRYPTIAEALRGVPGVYAWDDRSYVSLGFRGLGRLGGYGNRVLVLADGHPLNDDWIGSSYVGYDGRVSLDDVERIEVVRGPGSVLYGTNAFSGVVNLVARRQPGRNGAEVGVDTAGDGVARARVRGDASFGADSGMWASAAIARGQGRDFFFPEYVADTPPEVAGNSRGADGFEAGTLEGRAYAGFLTAGWYLQAHDKRIPTGEYETLLADPRAKQRDTRSTLELKAEPTLGGEVASMSRVHLNHYRFRGGYPRAVEDGGLEVDTFRGSWVGLEQRFVWSASEAFALTLGGEGQFHFQVEQQARDETGVFLDEERPYELGAAYLVADARPSSAVRISAGARLDVYSTFGESLNPRVALVLEPYSGGNLKVIGGKAFRAPSVYELYYNDEGFTQIPSPDLEPENIYSAEIEHTHRFSPTLSASLAVFGNTVHDLILDEGEGDEQDPLYYVNSDAPIVTFGAEVGLQRDWRQGFMFSLWYSFQHSRFVASESLADLFEQSPEFRHVENSPAHLVTLKGALPIVGRAVTLGSRLTFESGRWDRNERVGEAPQTQTEAFAIWDVVISGEEPRWGLGWAVGVYNAFDWRYVLPVSGEFRQLGIEQSGRTLLLSTDLAF